MSLTPLPIRLFCDLAAPVSLLDLNRSQPPQFYRGDDIEIDIGIGQNGALLTSLTNVASVTCQIYESENDTNGPMMSATVTSINTALTQSQWNTGAGEHAAFTFAHGLTAISLGGATAVNYWLRVFAQTSDSPAKIITLLDGPITVRDGPISTLSAPPLAGARLFSVNGQAVFQLLDSSTGLYHTLAVLNNGGVLSLQLSDQGY